METARVRTEGNHQCIELPEGIEVVSSVLEIRQEGDRLVLIPVHQEGPEIEKQLTNAEILRRCWALMPDDFLADGRPDQGEHEPIEPIFP